MSSIEGSVVGAEMGEISDHEMADLLIAQMKSPFQVDPISGQTADLSALYLEEARRQLLNFTDQGEKDRVEEAIKRFIKPQRNN